MWCVNEDSSAHGVLEATSVLCLHQLKLVSTTVLWSVTTTLQQMEKPREETVSDCLLSVRWQCAFVCQENLFVCWDGGLIWLKGVARRPETPSELVIWAVSGLLFASIHLNMRP